MATEKPPSDSLLREIRQDTAQQLRRAGMDGRRADEVSLKVVKAADAKANGQPVPERFRPITDSRSRR